MIGNRVRVVREGASDFEGVLLRQDSTGVLVHQRQGLADDRLFIPYSRIIEIRDLGRVP